MAVQYKEFRVGDIFDINSSNGIYHACNVKIEQNRTSENHPYIVRSSYNNGLRGYIKADESTLNPGNTISFAQDTAQMFYQNEPYFTGNKVKVVSIKKHSMTENIGLFLITCFKKAFSLFGWGQSYDTSVLCDVKISLPVVKQFTPDWEYLSAIGGIYMSEINASSWKKFKLSDLFGSAKLGKYHNPKDLVFDPNGYEYICASALNNGVNKDLPMVNGSDLSLTGANIIAWGKQCPVFTYHKNPCVTLQGMYYYELGNLTEEQALYVIAAMTRACEGKYGYDNCLIGSKADEIEIYLPAIEEDDPDWDYMQERIAELEQERIAELEQYLVASGLNDYELIAEDIEVLKERKEMREFRIGDLFISKNGDVDLQQKDVNGKGVVLVSSGEANTGVIGLTDVPAKIIPENTITVDMFRGVHYRDFPYKMVTHARVFALIPKFDMCREIGEFLTSVIKKYTTHFSYNNMCSWNKISDVVLWLPIYTNAINNPIIDSKKTYHQDGFIPDWEFMSRYIKAIEKLAIRDVVKFKDEMIQKTKQVVDMKESV